MRLSAHFQIREFGIGLSDQDIQNYFLLCHMVLEPVHDRFGVVKINSAKRSIADNERVGGVSTSQHVRGEAVDFWCPYAQPGMAAVFSFITQELRFKGEVLYYKSKGHIHVALPRYNVCADHLIVP